MFSRWRIMMTRDELLDTFQAKLSSEGGFVLPASVLSPGTAHPDDRSFVRESFPSVDGAHLLEKHSIHWWDGGEQVKRGGDFYVVDIGTAGENAVWIGDRDPKPPAPGPTFQDEMTTWLNSQLDVAFGTQTLRHVESISANNLLERGVANVIMETSGDFVRRSVAIWRDAQNIWHFQPISTG